jgi:hypothetical protein
VQKGQNNVKVYSELFAKNYHNLLNGMIERRMRAAVLAVACIWYSAWVDAGQPDLNKLYEASNEKPTKKDINAQLDAEMKALEGLKMIGRQDD